MKKKAQHSLRKYYALQVHVELHKVFKKNLHFANLYNAAQ